MPWKIENKTELLKSVPFNVERLDLIDPKTKKPLSHPYFRLNAPDWINVLPINQDQKAVLIRQPRVGSFSRTLEIPGGMVDPNETPDVAAKRELEEETGFRTGKLIHLASINPNPAIMTNLVHMYLAIDCIIVDERQHFPDQNEDIEVVFASLTDLPEMIRNRSIDHALAALTISLALSDPALKGVIGSI